VTEGHKTRLPGGMHDVTAGGDGLFYRLLLEANVYGVLLVGADGAILDANAEASRVLGRSREDIIVAGAANIFDASEDQLRDAWEGLRHRGRWEGELRVLRRDGSAFPAEVSLVGFRSKGAAEQMSGVVFRDVTERKKIEQELRFLSLVAQNSLDLVMVTAPDRTVTYVSPSIERIMGYRPEEMVGTKIPDYRHPDDSARVQQWYEEIKAIPGVNPRPVEARYRRKDGSWVYFESLANNLLDDPSVGGVVFNVRDITERKQAEEVKRQRDFYEALLQAQSDVGEGLFLVEERRIRFANEALCRMSGYDAGELTALPTCFDLIVPEQRPVLEDRMRRRLRGEEVEDRYETAMLRKDRRRVDAEFAVRLLRRGDAPQLMVIARDISERKRTDRSLRESEQRLQELVGKLLTAQDEERRRVAYEVHDELAQTAVATQQLLETFADKHPPESPELAEDMGRILMLSRQTVEDARRVISNLRPTALDDFGLAAAIRIRIAALRAEGWDVAYEETLNGERLPVELETALYRVAQEALTNARKHARTARLSVVLGRAGRTVRLRVRDRGRGFRPEESSAGTGAGERVGISGMRERIALLRGRLRVYSRPGAGTLVVAKVPLDGFGEADRERGA
jgi:PAS domain S-box-containing protein